MIHEVMGCLCFPLLPGLLAKRLGLACAQRKAEIDASREHGPNRLNGLFSCDPSDSR